MNAKNSLSTTQNELIQAHNSFVKTGALALVKQRDQLQQFEKTIQLMHPINVLKRGYSIVTNQSGVLSENNNPTTNTTVTITTAFGALDAIITKETTPL